MSGVMAGTTILSATAERTSLGTVTLTINNTCNLRCPHCYLDYEGSRGPIGDEVVEAVLASSCEHISIVGKEPFASRDSIACVGRIVERAAGRGKTVSVITNGLNAALVPQNVVRGLAWIDVSLDGGALSYESYRGGSWTRLKRSVAALHEHGARDLRVLQTLSRRTVAHIDDMVHSSRALGATLIMFSAFRPTRALGVQQDQALDPITLVESLAPYAADPDIRLSLDSDYATHFVDVTAAINRATQLMGDRFGFVSGDPIRRGIIRVTYEGMVMTPLEAIHASDYGTSAMIGTETLDMLFAGLLDGAGPASALH